MRVLPDLIRLLPLELVDPLLWEVPQQDRARLPSVVTDVPPRWD
jgi:hypothetical protein